jgi:hypothetical protein
LRDAFGVTHPVSADSERDAGAKTAQIGRAAKNSEFWRFKNVFFHLNFGQ